jgi:agmatine deiminase
LKPPRRFSDSANENIPAGLGFRMPAEWEPHEATWIGWPHNETDWPGKIAPIHWVYGEIVRKITPGELVRILVNSAAHEVQARKVLKSAGVSLGSVQFLRFPTNRGWTRDFGPIFVKRLKPRPEVAIARFRFNAWAHYPDWKKDDAVPAQAARRLKMKIFRILLGERDVVLEGGSIDDLCRFVNRSTIVLCREKNSREKNYRALEENRERLHGARLENGSKPDVIALPMPSPLFFDGVRLPASYANFYISNSAVLVPTFNDPNDRVALGILGDLFPTRSVVGIHCVDLVWGFGTIHCLTQQQPSRS